MIQLNSISFNNVSFTAKNKKKTSKQVAKGTSSAQKTCFIPSTSLQQFMIQRKPSNANKLSIYYYNDTHGNSDSMADVLNSAKHFADNASNNATFVLSAGDNCSGGDAKKNEFIFDLMQNVMGVDCSAVGNHEIDAESEGFYKAAKDKNITFVATNVRFSADNKMRDVVKKSVIKEKNGVKYGFIGTMPIDFKTITRKSVQKGLDVMDFDDTVNALQSEIDNLRAQGINRIIMLSHVGYDLDKQIVSNLDGVDIVIGGHTHTVIQGAGYNENVLRSKSGEPVVITQGGENGNYYGVLNVEFDDTGKLIKVDNNLVSSTNKSKSPVVEYIKSQNLGVSPHVGTIKDIEPMPQNRRIEPCAWTEVMADSMKEILGVQIALINSANIRKVPKQGNLTERDVMESTPMKNKLLKVKITQKQLVEAVKNAAKTSMGASDGYPGLIQGSGFTYKIDDTGNLLDFNIKESDGKLTPVDINNPSENVKYTACYDTFMATEGGETPELAVKSVIKEYDFDKDYTMCQYLSKLKDREALVIKHDNRIEIVKTSGPKLKGNNTRKI